MVMLRSFQRPLERCLGIHVGDALMWQVDLRPYVGGEYSVAMVQANASLEDQSRIFTSPSATYFGVYDGHGGPEASRFVNRHLFPFMRSNNLITLISTCDKFAQQQGGLSEDAITKAFHATEEEFCHTVNGSFSTKPKMTTVGSCCLVGAISSGTLYVANLGDSRAVLGRISIDNSRRVVAERLSTDHNVAVEEVRKEVKALHPDDSLIVLHTRGHWRIKGIIQVSRSIGDLYLKKPEFYRNPLFPQYGNPVPLKRPVISAEPSILVRKLKPQDLFLIFASDGLWEQLTDEEAVGIVLKNPRKAIAEILVKTALRKAATKMDIKYNDLKKIDRGIRRHFHDDISVIVVFLDQHKLPSDSKYPKHDEIMSPVDIYTLYSGEPEVNRLLHAGK